MPRMTDTQPLVTGTQPLTCCCPARRRSDLSPAEWQQHWGLEAYVQWTAGCSLPPVAGRALILNRGQAPFTAAAPDVFYVEAWPTVAAGSLAAVFALQVLERVDSPTRFLRQVATALAPGGLLACTFASWDAEGEDCAVGHELRKRIYSPKAWRELVWEIMRKEGFSPLGPIDWSYKGHALGDHTIATAVVVKTAGRV